MSTQLSPQDWEKLSAYLDNQLSARERRKLEERLRLQANLRAGLGELRRTKDILRSAPKLRPPRNFTLTEEMAGISSSRPRTYPVFRLAFAMASILFVLTIAGDMFFGTLGSTQVAAPLAGESFSVQQEADTLLERAVAEPEMGIVEEVEEAAAPLAEAPAAVEEPEAMALEDNSSRAMDAPSPDSADEVGDEPPAEPVQEAPAEEGLAAGADEGNVIQEEKIDDMELETETPTQDVSPSVAEEPGPQVGNLDQQVPEPSDDGVVFSQFSERISPWRLLQILFGGVALVSGLIAFYLRRRA